MPTLPVVFSLLMSSFYEFFISSDARVSRMYYSKCNPVYTMIQMTRKEAIEVMNPSLVNSHTPP